MTTMQEIEVECCICRKTSTHMGIASTNSFGSPDLDTRPPEMQRSTIYYWIQRCPSCGYCSSDLSICSDNVREILESEEYQDIINDKSIPDEAVSFLALSYEKQRSHQYSDSAWRAIHAAWICDDNGNDEAARKCRKKALYLIQKGEDKSQKIADQEGASEAITIDLMRRAGLFEQAMEMVEKTKEIKMEAIISQVIRYEKELTNLKDVDSHRISDVVTDE